MHCMSEHSCHHHQHKNNSYVYTIVGGHDFYINNGMNGGSCNLGYDYAFQIGSYSQSQYHDDFSGNHYSCTITAIEVWLYEHH